jgi:thioredoxin-dependent peroxiredoxin
VESHKSFRDELDLPYTLLSDEDGSVRKLYDVPTDFLGLLPGRQTYIIGKDGTVKEVFNNQFSPEKHVEVALSSLN